MKRSLSWALRGFVTIGLLSIILASIPVAQVGEAILRSHPGLLTLGLASSLLVVGLEALKLQLLLARQGMPVTVRRVLAVNLAAKFYGLFLPGYLSGGVLRWYRFAHAERKWSEVLASIAFGRLIDTVILVGLGLAFWLIARPAGAGWIVGAVLMTLLGLLLAAHGFVSRPHADAASWRPLARVLPRAIRPGFERLAGTTAEGYRLCHGLTGTTAGLSLLVQLGGMASFLCFARSLDIGIAFVDIGWIRSVVVILLALPISIAGFGVREGSLLLLMPPYGVSNADTVALSFLLFGAGLVIRLLGGLVELRYALGTAAGKRQGTVL